MCEISIVLGEANMDTLMFKDIPQYNSWTKIEKINYGWSSDEKYFIEDKNNEKLLLRISSIESYDNKKMEFSIIEKFNQLDFPMSKAIEIGICNKSKNVYMLLTWVDGQSMEKVLSSLMQEEQYNLGLEAGRILREIHSIQVNEEDFPKVSKVEKKLRQLERYEKSKYRVPKDEAAIAYVKENINLMCKNQPVYKHGDFHPGNLIYTQEGQVGVIDFNRWECGDPYEEFYKLQSFTVEESIPFSIGQLHGYFKGEPTLEFWRVQAVYVAHAALYSIEWAVKFGQKDIDNMTRICERIFKDYDGFKLLIPRWYEKK